MSHVKFKKCQYPMSPNCPCYLSPLRILNVTCGVFFYLFSTVCFTRYFVVSIAVLPHSPGVVYYHLLLRQETRIPGVAPISFRIFVHR